MNRITHKQKEKIFRKKIREHLLEVFVPENQIAEKSVSKSQQRFFGMVDAIQKGELDPDTLNNSEKFTKAASSIKHKDVEDFASTKHKGLPNTVDETKLLTSGNHKLIVDKDCGINAEGSQIIANAIKFACKELKINEPCVVHIVGNREKYNMETLAYFNPNTKETVVYGKDRLKIDTCRSCFHELTHLRQLLRGELDSNSGSDGDKIENEANALAGVLCRKFSRMDKRVFS